MLESKSLGNSDQNTTTKNVPDVVFFGDGDTFKLICKASSKKQGWMKSTKAMEIPGVGCVVQVTTQQKTHDGNYVIAEALTFVPGTQIEEQLEIEADDESGQENVVARQIVSGVAARPAVQR